VPVLREDSPQRGRPDARSTGTGCRVLLSGAAGIEKDILFSTHRANVLRGGCLPTQRGSGGAAFTNPLPGLQPRLEGELPPNSAIDDQHPAIQKAGSGRPDP
ncbi:Histone H3, partial [Giardia duodenalis]